MSSEISDAVAGITKAKAEQLREEFADTLGEGATYCGISIVYNEDIRGQEQTRQVFGVPYGISDGNLIIGPYEKDVGFPVPEDYHQRKMSILIAMIIAHKRINL